MRLRKAKSNDPVFSGLDVNILTPRCTQTNGSAPSREITQAAGATRKELTISFTPETIRIPKAENAI